jgi:hypothetical protein
MHIGLIGRIGGRVGPAATEYCYRGLIARHAKSNTHLELTIAHADARELVHNLANGDAPRQAEVFARLVGRLAVGHALPPRAPKPSFSAAPTPALHSRDRLRISRARLRGDQYPSALSTVPGAPAGWSAPRLEVHMQLTSSPALRI